MSNWLDTYKNDEHKNDEQDQ